MNKIYVVGCGGVASYFLPQFLRTLKNLKEKHIPENVPVCFVDGDVLEEKNLQRQHFPKEFVGKPKVEALVNMYKDIYPNLENIPNYVTEEQRFDDNSFIFCFVDNHPARFAILNIADATSSMVLCAANSSIAAHAYFYHPGWMGLPLDPRVRYPEIETTLTGSPIKVHRQGCDSVETMAEIPQTPIANSMAANHALLLWNFWVIERLKLNRETTKHIWPIEFFNTFTKVGQTTIGEIENADKDEASAG